MKAQIAPICLLVPIIAFAGNSVPLRLTRNYPVVEGVYVNGAGPFRFLLDTGAQSSSIRLDVARELHLKPAYRVNVATNAGSHEMIGTMVDRISLGDRPVERVELVMHDLAGIGCLDRRIQGVLGQNFLSKFNYLLDYKNRRLVFDDAPQPPPGARIKFERIDQCPAIQIEGPRKPLRLVLDSGSSDLILFADPAEWPAAAEARLMGTASQQRVKMSWLPELRVGSEVMRNVAVGIAPRDPARGQDGLLPTSLFKAVYFNNREDFVILNATLP
jgi:hypothetical protein